MTNYVILLCWDRVPLASKFSDTLLLALGFKLLLLMVHLLLLVTWCPCSQQVGPREGLLVCPTDRRGMKSWREKNVKCDHCPFKPVKAAKQSGGNQDSEGHTVSNTLQV